MMVAADLAGGMAEPHGGLPTAAPGSLYHCPADWLQRARDLGPARLAVAAAAADEVLQSVIAAASSGIVEPVLVGEVAAIHSALREQSVAPSRFPILAANGEEEAARIAVGLVSVGDAQMLMKGHLHTDVLMRAVLAPTGGMRDKRRLSHVFALRWPGAPRDLIIADAALNVAPNQETMLHIVRNAILVARTLGISHPRIAMVSASEVVNPAMPSSVAASDFVTGFRHEAEGGGCFISGPLALDLAISSESAALKGLADDPVAGRADILVMPNIETGNALFKALVHLLHATAAGVVLGASAPIVLTSRADPAEAKLASIALARLLCSHTQNTT